VVDKPGEVAAFRGVYNGFQVYPEEVGRSDALGLVVVLPQVREHGPDHLADVLDHHFIRGDLLHGEQAPVVDARLGELQLLLTELRPNNAIKPLHSTERERNFFTFMGKTAV